MKLFTIDKKMNRKQKQTASVPICGNANFQENILKGFLHYFGMRLKQALSKPKHALKGVVTLLRVNKPRT